jgi:hypothetical protein
MEVSVVVSIVDNEESLGVSLSSFDVVVVSEVAEDEVLRLVLSSTELHPGSKIKTHNNRTTKFLFRIVHTSKNLDNRSIVHKHNWKLLMWQVKQDTPHPKSKLK